MGYNYRFLINAFRRTVQVKPLLEQEGPSLYRRAHDPDKTLAVILPFFIPYMYADPLLARPLLIRSRFTVSAKSVGTASGTPEVRRSAPWTTAAADMFASGL